MRKIAGLAMVRNEADIIEAFVRYNLTFLDELIIVLHSPHDDTARIIEQLKAEGLPLVIKHNHELGFSKAEWMNRVAREVLAAKRADFLFMLDADEFIKCSSRAYLDEAISAIPVGATAALKWESYVPTPDDASSERNVVKRIQHRAARETNRVCKVTLCKRFADDTSLTIADGNHAVLRGRSELERPVPHVSFRGVSLAHFPVRSESQLVSKAFIGIWSRWVEQGRVDKSMRISNHWLQFYQELMAGGNLSQERLRDIALNYDAVQTMPQSNEARALILDPLTVDFDLKYTPASETSSLANISRWVEMLIDQPTPSVVSQQLPRMPFQAPRNAAH
jgi:glycosyltransferase involved in cell wall biosynthesis